MEKIDQYKKSLISNQPDYDALLPLYYNFIYDDLPFSCKIHKEKIGNSFILNLSADLGIVPYSAENKLHRELILKEFGPMIAQGKAAIDRHCRLHFPFKTNLGEGFNAKILIETILYTLLDVRTTLKQIKETLETSHYNDVRKQTA